MVVFILQRKHGIIIICNMVQQLRSAYNKLLSYVNSSSDHLLFLSLTDLRDARQIYHRCQSGATDKSICTCRYLTRTLQNLKSLIVNMYYIAMLDTLLIIESVTNGLKDLSNECV